MRVAIGKVISGKVVVEGEPLEEGAVVTVLPEDNETFELNPEAETALLAAIDESERGEIVSGDEVLRKLNKNG